MQPDMPNLMAGLIMFGWAFFLGGFFVGRLGRRAQTKTKSELAAAPDRSLPPSLDSAPPIRGSDDSDPGRVTITALARQNVGGK